MKKNLLLLLCTTLFMFISCEDEPIDGDLTGGGEIPSCATAIENTVQAAVNFSASNADTYTQLCIAYRNALQSQILACGDDDGSVQLAIDALGDCLDENQQSTDVEGTWLLTSWLGENPIDLNNDGVESDNFLDEMDCYTNETIVFSNDGTAVAMSTSYAEFDVYIEVGTTNSYDYTVNCIDEIENTSATWEQSGNIISITDVDGTSEWTLNGNQLSIVVPSAFFAISEDASITVTEDLTFIYTKQ
ncbi:hypothetical protein [Psychroserpens algicola]|uniref:Lipocalin-like domain-containing protein n=1 Tax=Psychroserpens algicola TaxID=1719034 RepID=A0ABT0H7B0_9FLAO|nr:hypothetical protein [Psychroserpens algicola]MCK8479919.1 hypothetical protein [Psychroserpens algicola]